MKEVIIIPEVSVSNDKPIEVTHEFIPSDGWVSEREFPPTDKVIYLGKCALDGDMFAAYYRNRITIYKGHLNSGKY